MAKPRVNDPLTAQQLRAALTYLPATGFFMWNHIPERSRDWNTKYAGTKAGTPKALRGEIQIMINGRLYLAHRLACLWMTGQWPEDEIDHIDTDPANNRWENLRPATRSQGQMNTLLRSDNTSGGKGVWFEKRRNRWIAEITANGTKHHLGSFPTAEAAQAVRDKAARRLHGKFARG